MHAWAALVVAAAGTMACGAGGGGRAGRAPTAAPEGAGSATQEPAPEPEPDEHGLLVRLTAASGRDDFAQGERILVRLTFENRGTGTYRLDRSDDARFAPGGPDELLVTPPAGVSDPLADLFAGAEAPPRSPRGGPLPASTPETVELDTSRWLRFDRPGAYTLRIRTRRVAGAEGFVPLQTNPLRLRIRPAEPDVQARIVATAARLHATGSAPERLEAARDLAALATEPAAVELARALATEPDPTVQSELDRGLVASPFRERALLELQRWIDAPDVPVGARLLQIAALLEHLRVFTASPSSRRIAWASPSQVHDDLAQRVRSVAARVAQASEHKAGRARAETLATLAELSLREPSEEPPWLAAVRAGMAAGLRDLPTEVQERLLIHAWRRIADPSLLPALREIVADAGASIALRSVALRRLVALSPVEARALLLDEIRQLPRRVDLLTLTALPAGPIRELDEDLATALETGTDASTTARLVARHGSERIRGRVARAYEARARRLGPEGRGALAAYLLRFDPPAGRRAADGLWSAGNGSSDLERSLAAFAAQEPSPALESVLLEWLRGPDPARAIQAAKQLGATGSVAARPALEARLAQLRDTWRGREEALRLDQTAGSPNALQVRLEEALVRALVTARSWFVSPDEIERMQAAALSEAARRQARNALASARQPAISIQLMDHGGTVAVVGQYRFDNLRELEDKLTQYARGSEMDLYITAGRADDGAAARDELRASAQRCGLTLREH